MMTFTISLFTFLRTVMINELCAETAMHSLLVALIFYSFEYDSLSNNKNPVNYINYQSERNAISIYSSFYIHQRFSVYIRYSAILLQ